MIYSGRSITVENSSDPALDEIARYRFGSDLSVALANVTETTLAKDGGTAKVGSYMPNAWGFYDMIGNVSEWCLDRTPDPCAGMTAEARDPAGSVDESHKNRIVRGGGGWGGWPYNLRCAYRSGQWYKSASKTTGFRLWCPIKVTEP